MSLTPETLPRHELAGLPVRVLDATDPTQVGTAGRVVRETTKTLLVEADSGVVQVPKRGARFAFTLTDEAAGTGEAVPDVAPAAGRRGRKAPGIGSKLSEDTAGTAAGSPGQSPGGEGSTYVTVDGDVLLARPARRTEHGVDTLW
jgi:ribonuclease P protein subunit POP4